MGQKLIVETIFYETPGDLVRKSKYALDDISPITVLQSGTVGLSSCINYKIRLYVVISVTVLTAAQVICLVCFFECASQLSVINHQTKFKNILQRWFSAIFSDLRRILSIWWQLVLVSDVTSAFKETSSKFIFLSWSWILFFQSVLFLTRRISHLS